MTVHLECPACHRQTVSEIIDSRANERMVRRRRVCTECHERFTTYEMAIDLKAFDDQRRSVKTIAARLREMARTLENWSA